jgi:hypothetical protein
MSPYDFVQYQYELRNKDGYQDQIDKFIQLYGNYNPTYDDNGQLIDVGIDKYRIIKTKNWQDEVFGKEAFNYTHNINISGGNSNWHLHWH